MNADEQRKIIDDYIAAYNAFDVERMLACVHPDVEFKNVPGGEVNATGAEEFGALARQSGSMFSSRRQRITGFQAQLPGPELQSC